MDRPPEPPPSAAASRDHLANERTYLAWIRTAITVLGLGFVVGKFGVWLRYMSTASSTPAPPRGGLSVPLAIGMIAVGAALALIGGWRYRHVRRAIETGRVAAAGPVVVTVTCVVTGLAVLMLFILAWTA